MKGKVMDMKMNKTTALWGALMIGAFFMASLSIAQEKIADGDLLKMLENANSAPVEKPEPPADSVIKSNPIERTMESVQIIEERA